MSIGVCGYTQLPIPNRTNVGAILLVSSNGAASRFPFDLYKPVTPIIWGTWRDGFAPLRIHEKRNEEIGTHIGTPKINFSTAPLNHYWWFIREDTYHLLETLPVTDGENGKQNIAEIVDLKRAEFVEKLEEAFELYHMSDEELLSRVSAEDESAGRMYIGKTTLTSLGLRQFMGQAFRYPEGQNSPALEIIYAGLDRVMKAGGSVTWDAKPYIDDFFALLTLYNAMTIGRRALFPHGLYGSRYDTDSYAHYLIGSHIQKVSQRLESEEDEDDDA